MEEYTQMQRLLEDGDVAEAERLLAGMEQWNADMAILSCLFQIYHKEMEHNCPDTVFSCFTEIAELTAHFVRVKLLLRRLEFDLPEERQRELYPYCKEKRVSVYFFEEILRTNIFRARKVCGRLTYIYEEQEGKNSQAVSYFSELERTIGEQADE